MTKREYYLRYLILKIQFLKDGEKILSHRQLSIKFNMSKSFFTNLYKILEQNQIIKKQNNQILVNKNKESMFFSYGGFFNNNIEKIQIINKKEIPKIPKLFLEEWKNQKIDINKYIYISKIYKRKKYNKEIQFMIKKPLENNDEKNNELLKESIFNYFSYNGISIFSKFSLNKIYDNDIYKLEFFANYEGEMVCYTFSKIHEKSFGYEQKKIF